MSEQDGFHFNGRKRALAATYCHCGKTAFYRVGKRGFCKAHKIEAFSEEKERSRSTEYQRRKTGMDEMPE